MGDYLIDLDALALEVRDALRDHPEMTVDDLALQFGVDHDVMVLVLDEYHVNEDASVTRVGPGGGGGWMDDATRERLFGAQQ